MEIIRTKGNVIVNDIEIGDVHYEYEYGTCIQSEVLTKPEIDKDGNWCWDSKNLNTGKIINYGVSPGYTHYSVNLYDYEAYDGCKFI